MYTFQNDVSNNYTFCLVFCVTDFEPKCFPRMFGLFLVLIHLNRCRFVVNGTTITVVEGIFRCVLWEFRLGTTTLTEFRRLIVL